MMTHTTKSSNWRAVTWLRGRRDGWARLHPQQSSIIVCDDSTHWPAEEVPIAQQ